MNKKLILISTSSLLAVSPLIVTISCNKTEDVDKKLSEAVNSFTITLKSGQDISNVLASQVNNETTLLQYFDLGGQITGVTYTFESATPVTNDSTKLNVIYKISYQGQEQQASIELSGFKQETTEEEDGSTDTSEQDQTN